MESDSWKEQFCLRRKQKLVIHYSFASLNLQTCPTFPAPPLDFHASEIWFEERGGRFIKCLYAKPPFWLLLQAGCGIVCVCGCVWVCLRTWRGYTMWILPSILCPPCWDSNRQAPLLTHTDRQSLGPPTPFPGNVPKWDMKQDWIPPLPAVPSFLFPSLTVSLSTPLQTFPKNTLNWISSECELTVINT